MSGGDAALFDYLIRAGGASTLALVIWALLTGRLYTPRFVDRLLEELRLAREDNDRLRGEVRECNQREFARAAEYRAIAESQQAVIERQLALLEAAGLRTPPAGGAP